MEPINDTKYGIFGHSEYSSKNLPKFTIPDNRLVIMISECGKKLTKEKAQRVVDRLKTTKGIMSYLYGKSNSIYGPGQRIRDMDLTLDAYDTLVLGKYKLPFPKDFTIFDPNKVPESRKYRINYEPIEKALLSNIVSEKPGMYFIFVCRNIDKYIFGPGKVKKIDDKHFINVRRLKTLLKSVPKNTDTYSKAKQYYNALYSYTNVINMNKNKKIKKLSRT